MNDLSRGLHTSRQYVVHAPRVVLLGVIIALIHWQQTRLAKPSAEPIGIELQHASRFFPDAASIGTPQPGDRGVPVLNDNGQPIGYILQTSPRGDRVIGFSGPTNVLLAFDQQDRILGFDVLSSGDTREHVQQVRADKPFMSALNGMTWEQAANVRQVDGVSGATLTSLAMREAILHRLGGGPGSLRFPEPLTLAEARPLLPQALQPKATTIQQDPKDPASWHVLDAQDHELGSILRTSPAADNIVGYQGPTDTRIAIDRDGQVTGMALGKSYDNEPYVSYVRDDQYFMTWFNGLRLDELARLDLAEAEVEGVSGATMTSMAVAEGMLLAAQRHAKQSDLANVRSRWQLTLHDIGTAIVILAAMVIGMTRLRADRRLRVALQLVVIGYLGLAAGNLLSQAMIVGWAQHGIPWRSATGLALLLVAALAIPVTTRRNLYCSHLCPHGAAQQLLRRRLPWQLKLPVRARFALRMLPPLLLALSIIVGMTSSSLSLVDMEPFDAYVFRVAGWATMTIAIVGLVASLFLPMAYCRFGCPTGAMLEFLRLNAKSDRWTRRDWVAVGLTGLALALVLL